MLTLTSYGAAEEVTGSKHLIETKNARVLVDCGLFQGHREAARAKNEGFPFAPYSLYACVNTHGHLDHCGTYPLLAKKGFQGEILSTPATRDVSGLVMQDSARIQAQDARFLDRQQGKDPQPWRKVYPPLYDEKDVEQALSQFVGVSYGREYALAPNIHATLYDAGHILGSAMVRFEVFEGPEPLAIGFTGDLGRKNTPLLKDPEVLPPLDYLVCESTYGDRRHDPISTAEDELADVIRETAAKGGRVIIPAFAVERTQELIYFLHRLHDAGRIPSMPVFVDSPMAVSATAIFRTHPECLDAETAEQFLDNGESPFAFDNLKYVTDAESSKKINDVTMPCIIIATAGMCEAGRILHHLVHGVGDPRNTILVVGFMGENTLGRALADKRPEVRIFGQRHAVRARVKIINAFSAHADYLEIGDYIQSLDQSRLKRIFLVHGESSAQAHLAQYLKEIGTAPAEILKPGAGVEIE
jgi:metallo-beta-lactamase family protein